VKILYVSQYYAPEMGAPAARVAELAQHWVKEGHDVTVLTGFPNHPTGVVPHEYRSKFRRLIFREELNGVKVVRSWLLPFPNRKAYERMLNYSSFCVSAATAGMFLDRPDALIATSPQLLVGLAGCWLAKVKRVPFIFEVRDLWPESLAAVGVGGDRSLLNRSLGKIAGFLYKHADHVVVVAPAFVHHLVRNWNVPEDKISVVENGVEAELFAPRDASTLRRQLNLQDKFVVGYVGTMGIAHGLDTVLQAAAELIQKSPEVVFLMVGEGADKERIASLAQQRGLTNIVWIAQQRRERMPELISAADVCLVSLKKTELFKTVIPTKMLEFMSCARPVIVAVDGQAREIVENAKAGVFVEPENASALVAAVQTLKGNSSMRATLGKNGRYYITKHLSRRQTATTYIRVLENLLARRRQQTSATA
jgi:glycosyltransferase involved in cell wall biosynthesis